MKIAFHANEISLRGTGVAMFDYAHYNKKLLGNESIVLHWKGSTANHPLAYEKYEKHFEIFGYDDWSEVDGIIKAEQADFLYMIKGGEKDGKITDACKTGIHAVFQNYEPHGDVYAYVSEWLSQKMTSGKLPYVPHMINMPQPNADMRQRLNIPEHAVVLGRHGGKDQFDLPVAPVIERAALNNRFLYFVFLNTDRFCMPLPNIIHLDPIYDLQEKSNFIGMCDAMIHARVMGESFGLAIAEFLYHDKPVIAWPGGGDQNHVKMLGEEGLWYNNPEELYQHLISAKHENHNGKYSARVEKYTPENVMNKFNQVFIEGVEE
jgi:glycosyltransferase involved in cell wall biosynthesis